MRALRGRSSIITSVVLLWQFGAVLFLPATLACRQAGALTHQGSLNVAMANCPMHHEEAASADPSCPFHTAKKGAHECDCPSIGCSQTDKEFMAVYGPVGILPAPSFVAVLDLVGDTAAVITGSTSSLAPVPLAPPPRA